MVNIYIIYIDYSFVLYDYFCDARNFLIDKLGLDVTLDRPLLAYRFIALNVTASTVESSMQKTSCMLNDFKE